MSECKNCAEFVKDVLRLETELQQVRGLLKKAKPSRVEVLFAKYVKAVRLVEGVTFLYEGDWSADDWQIISNILDIADKEE